MIRKHFDGYNFVCIPETGATFRWGNSLSENPYRAPWPELADISISNYCTNACEYCYRSSNEKGRFMSLKDYKFVLEQLTSKEYGSIFQVALGGGEPLLHPQFNEILEVTEQHNIIPNYTTCGKFFNHENIEATKKYCGSVAISWDPYRNNLSLEELSKLGSRLADEGIKTNIHYVISERTIEMATRMLEGEYDGYIKDFNAIIFLTYKPTGRADTGDTIKSPKLLKSFLEMVDNSVTKIKIGFDACFVPSLLKATSVDNNMIDSCECGFFSVYVNENMDVLPCSFCNNTEYSYNLRDFNFEGIWQDKFSNYRNYVDSNCKLDCSECPKSLDCRGKCPFFDELFLCDVI